jgi:DNA-binding response OmpR family regulator
MPDILVVESHAYLRDFLRRALTRSGYRVRVAINEIDSLAAVAQQVPQLIVLDLFPINRARTLLVELRRAEHTAAILVIGLISADQYADEQVDALACQSQLCKPFALEDLLQQVRALIGDAGRSM